MKKENFVSLILGTVGGILFAIGMCMCLLPEWNAFNQGVVVAAIGAVVLIAMVIVRRKMAGKPAVELNGKAIGTVALGIVGALVLGVGMCMVMVWEMMIPGMDYIYVNELGERIKPNYITQHFPLVLQKNGMRKIRFHDGCIKIGLNQKQPRSKGGTDLVLFYSINIKEAINEEYG